MLSQAVMSAFEQMCESLDTPRSLMCSMLSRYGEHRQLAELSIDALGYLDHEAEKFRNDYLVTEFLSKYEGLDTGIDTEAAAYSSFTAAEAQCAETNRRVRALLEDNGSCPWIKVICLAQMKIEACLGTHPKFAKFIDRFRWGPGATFSIKGEEVRLDYKLCEEQITVTKRALPYLRGAMATDYAWLRSRGIDAAGPVSLLDSEFRVVRGSRGLTVPKNAKTDRFIAAEPTGNIFLQLGVGGYIRQCLHRVGVDLDDQSINQDLARRALDLGLATVDLKAASDTIASAVVWQLLPYSWASFLWDLRSHEMLVQGSWLALEKFSSMGNGFTFELESLIFWALTESLRDVRGLSGRVSVYGDDIICPMEMAVDLRSLLAWCGFTFNVKKSHYADRFRESCGKHFFGGKDVTPIYQKERPSDLSDAYRFHNRLFYHALDRGFIIPGHGIADRRLLKSVRTARRAIEWERDRQLRLQDQLGKKWDVFHELPVLSDGKYRVLDGGVLTPLSGLNTVRFESSRDGWRGYRAKNLVFIPDATVVDDSSAYYAVALRRTTACKLGFVDSEPFTGVVNLRRRGKWRSRDRFHPEACDVRWV